MGIILLAGVLAATANPPPLHYRFEIARAEGVLYNPWTRRDDKVELRSFIGSGAKPGDFVAPTIRVAPGQRLDLDYVNRLEPCTGKQQADHACFNDTNIHTHGLWVSPSGASDNVLISIPPGGEHRYVYDIPADHPAGTFWYHPHRHGSGFVQVGSGMAGALVVTGDRLPAADRPGDVDVLLKDANGKPFAERVLIFQQIQYGCLDAKGEIEGQRDDDKDYVRPFLCKPGQVGSIESFDNDWDWQWSGRFTGINGKIQPVLASGRTGAFERWRLIHAGTRETIHMRLYRLDRAAPELHGVRGADQDAWMKRYCTGSPLPMWQIAMDGLTRSAVRRTDEAILFPGERTDMLVRLPEPGRYCMVQDTSRLDSKKRNPSRMLSVVEAHGPAVTGDPDELLEAQLVRSAERALAGPAHSAMRAQVVGELRAGMKLTAFDWHKPVPDSEVSGYREALLNIIETPKDALFRVNGRTYDHDRIDQVLPLGKAEEWHAVSLLGDHPLHMHVNPFQIVAITDPQGRDVTDPASPAYDPDYAGLKGEWKDTVMLKQDLRIAFRTRYERFTGDFVTHCHIMYHGDHGMMQNLRIAADGTGAAPVHEGH
jgi:FtsP/CotA-like multicopper oxidase with cupredoxin domain